MAMLILENGKKIQVTEEELAKFLNTAEEINVNIDRTKPEFKGRVVSNRDNVDVSEAVLLENDEHEHYVGLTQEALQRKFPRFARK